MQTTTGAIFFGTSKCERAKSQRFAYEVLEHELMETSPRNKGYTDTTEGKHKPQLLTKLLHV
jgi:hypothetical protein